MDLTSSSHLTWGRFLNRFHSIPTSLWPPPAKSSAHVPVLSRGYILEKTLRNKSGKLLSKVYPNIQQSFKDQDWLSHRENIASRNDVVE
ncbi:hypothetical protein TNCT_190381 [Trichonephila clavata]|uniref:Uncharacterized protein n=1 Tax=Trichonephila clavata TaxID=2740835 RepID=A0A8X6K1B6_TRICU|nr:hypothetical protein TNCT_190381 [Trichonephila clavata]